MICEKCNKRKAVVKLVKVIGYKKVNYLLCEKCALEISGDIDEEILDEENINENKINEFSLSKFLGGLFEYMNLENEDDKKSKSCDICKTTYSEFREFNKLGCSKCYKVFALEIANSVKEIYGDKLHKTQKDLYDEKIEELYSLEQLLEKCVKFEEYEKAAQIRDKMKLIKEGRCDDGTRK
ncbi:MAG: UvrB/UvrC motif-containing protein [Sarcina sp.]